MNLITHLTVLFFAAATIATWPWMHSMEQESVKQPPQEQLALTTNNLSTNNDYSTLVSQIRDLPPELIRRIILLLLDTTLSTAFLCPNLKQTYFIPDHLFSCTNWCHVLAFNPCKSTFFIGTNRKHFLWNTLTNSEVALSVPPSTYISNKTVAFNPAGNTVLTGSGGNTACLWDVETGKLLQTFEGHGDCIYSTAFSPNGKYIVTGSRDNTARLWDVKTGQQVQQFTGHTKTIWAVACNSDGKTVLTGSEDATARLWDVETGALLKTFEVPSSSIYSVEISPDGKTALTGSDDKNARLWDIETGKQLHVLKWHTDIVWLVKFSPDGKTVLTGSDDETIRLWDVETGKEFRIMKGHPNGISFLTYNREGTTIVAGSYDASVHTWHLFGDVHGWSHKREKIARELFGLFYKLLLKKKSQDTPSK